MGPGRWVWGEALLGWGSCPGAGIGKAPWLWFPGRETCQFFPVGSSGEWSEHLLGRLQQASESLGWLVRWVVPRDV